MGNIEHLLAPHMRDIQASLADHIARFYPDVMLSLDQDRITLSSAKRSDDALRRVFQAALATEVIVQRSEPFRTAVIERLLQ